MPRAAAAWDRQTDGRIVVSLNALLLWRNNKRKRQKTSEVALKAPVSALTHLDENRTANKILLPMIEGTLPGKRQSNSRNHRLIKD